MRTRNWSQADRDEYAAACAEAWESGDSTAHRQWACDLTRQFAERGAQNELNAWRKATAPLTAVSHDGRLLTKTRVVGVQRHDDDGSRYVTQALFDLMTFVEIEEKVREYRSQLSAYADNIAVASRLLKLRERAPGAATPREAADSLGITVDDWLMDDRETA